MVEALINYYSIEHLFFGVAVAISVLIISKMNYRIPVFCLFVLVLYELFELKQWPNYWIENFANNIMDIVIGAVGVVIVLGIETIFSRKKSSAK